MPNPLFATYPRFHAAANIRLHQLLAADDFKGLEALFRAFFSGIPYDWHRKNDIANYEGYYASVVTAHPVVRLVIRCPG